MKAKLTQKTVRATLAPLGVTLSKNCHAEYVVRLKNAPRGEGYFTNDLTDALETGKLMAEREKTAKVLVSILNP
jgi:hypothetical protein